MLSYSTILLHIANRGVKKSYSSFACEAPGSASDISVTAPTSTSLGVPNWSPLVVGNCHIQYDVCICDADICNSTILDVDRSFALDCRYNLSSSMLRLSILLR